MTTGISAHKRSDRPSHVWETYKVKRRKQRLEYPALDTPIFEDKIRFVCVSDTHNHTKNYTFPIPDGDVLLHCGDFTQWGKIIEVKNFNTFLGTLPHRHKIVIAGNHEMCMDLTIPFRGPSHRLSESDDAKTPAELLTNCCYLEDAFVDLAGYKIYGAPWTPAFCSMAFSFERGEEALEKWNRIPSDTDILMVHGPPVGYGDKTSGGQHVGCVELLNTIQQRVKPRYCLYGHIHENHGVLTDGVTTFVNAAICDRRYRASHSPFIFDLPLPEGTCKADLEALRLTPVSTKPAPDDVTEECLSSDLEGLQLQ